MLATNRQGRTDSAADLDRSRVLDFGRVRGLRRGAGALTEVAVDAVADSANVAWNSDTSGEVLANDSASSGGLTLSAVTAPAHGTASIVGSSIQYSPTAGYFGPDSLTVRPRAPS